MGTAQDIVAPPSAQSSAALPTADDAFGTSASTLPSADEAFGTSPTDKDYGSHPFINHFVNALGTTILEHVAKNMAETGKVPSFFGYAGQVPGLLEKGEEASIKGGAQLESNIIAPALSPDQRQQLQNVGLYNQSSGLAEKLRNSGTPLTTENYKQLIAEGVMQSPVGQFTTAAYSTLMAPVAPLFDIAADTAKKSGASQGDVDLATAGLTILAVAHSGGVKGKVAEGLENHVTGSPESVFMGDKDPSPVMSEVASRSAEANAPGEKPAPTTFDNNAAARSYAPEVFKEYDDLQNKQDTWRSQIEDLKTQRDADITQKYSDEIADLQAKVDEAKARGKESVYGDILAKKIGERDTELANAEYTPQMKDLQKQIVEADYRRRDLAPQVTEAYKAVEEYRPPEPVQAEAPAAIKPDVVPAGETPAGALTPADNKIAEVLSKDLQTLGRSEEEANASGALVAAHYQALSDMGWAKGSAAELYAKYAPALRQGKDRVPGNVREFAQAARGKIRLATDDMSPIITLFKRADASTFVHETGHAWLDEMERFAKESDAPETLTTSLKTVRDWLGAKEGEELTRRQHEKFARGFERYMMEGVAPSRGLAQVFAKFKQWLTDIYRTVQKLRSPITDDIRDVFDRLLSANPEKQTLLAPDHEPGKIAADIHEADAKTTPPAEAEPVADNIRKEVDATIKLHAPEVSDEIKSAENAPNAAEAASDTGAPAEGQLASEGGVAQERGAVDTSGNDVASDSTGLRQHPGEGGRDVNAAANVGESSRSSAKPDKLDLVDKVGNIRWENLTEDKDVIAAARQAYEKAGSPLPRSVTRREMSDFAASLGIDEHLLNIEKLEALTGRDGIPVAFRIEAGRNFLKQSAERIRSMNENAARWTPEDALDYTHAVAQHVMVGRTISDVYSAWGQSGHALRDISNGEMKDIRGFEELLQATTGRTFEEIQKQAILGSKLKTNEQISKYVKEATQPTFVDKMLWYRNMCLLSGPITHAVYMEANLVNLITRPLLEVPTQAALGALRGAEERVYPGEAKEMLYALGPAMGRAFGNAAESWKEQMQVMPGAQGIKKYTTLVGQQQMIPGKFGAALNSVGRVIGALHSFIYTLAYEQNIAGLSYRQAMREGLDPSSTEFAARLNDLKTNQTPEMMDEASTSALNEMNMGKSGKVVGLISALSNSHPIGKFLFPFIKMEMNVKKQRFLERTPLGFILSKDIRANLMGANGELARDMQQGKMLAMTGTAGAIFTLASQYVNADGPSDPNKNRVWRLTHCPNSIQVGDSCFALKGLGNLGSLLQFGAAAKESLSGWEGNDGDHIAGAMAENLSKVLADGSFIQSLKNTLELAFHPQQNASKFIQNFATQFLPFSVGLGQVTKVIDPFRKDTTTESGTGLGANADSIMKAALARTPATSWMLQDQHDIFGQPISETSDYHDRYQNDPVVQQMNALHMGIGYLNKKVFGVKLDDKQYADYSQIAGILTKETLDRLVTPDFANRPAAQQIQAIHSVIEMCRDQAKQKILVKYPEVRDAAIDFQKTAHKY